MKKDVILRSLTGAPIGVTICYLITLIFSVIEADGNFYPVVPELIESCGSELNAVIIQTICALLFGAICGGASVIWQMEDWSLLRMTLTHLAVCSGMNFPIAYFMRWLPRSTTGILGYFGIFFGIYFGIWISQYSAMKRKIAAMNRKVQEQS